MEDLIVKFKKEFREQTGKNCKVIVCNKWESEATFCRPVDFCELIALVGENMGWQWADIYPKKYTNRSGKPTGVTKERSYRIGMMDYLAAHNGNKLLYIAKMTGRSNHTSVINSIKGFENHLETDYYLQKLFMEVIQAIRGAIF